MQLNENKIFKVSSRKMENCALYMYAKQSTREGIINDIFENLKNADFDALSKQAMCSLGAKLYVTKNEFKEVCGVIKKGCKNYNLSTKFIVETCIILAIKGLHKNGSLYISRNEIDTKGNSIVISVQHPYAKMLRCKIEPKYDKLSPSELITMAVKYVLKNKYECINILQKHVNITENDKAFLKELYMSNRNTLKEFEDTLSKLIKFHYKGKVTKTDFSIYNWLVDEFIIKYYKLDRNIFTIGKVIEKEAEKDPEPIPEKKDEEIIPDPKKDKLGFAQYITNKRYGKKEEEKNVTKDEIYGRVHVDPENTKIKDPVTNSSSDVVDDDDWIMMKILKLRRQLKHTKLELIIRDKE